MISKFVTAPVLLFGELLSIGAAKIALSSPKVMVSLMPISVGCRLECVGARHVLSAFVDRRLYRIVLRDLAFSRVICKSPMPLRAVVTAADLVGTEEEEA